MVADRVLVEVLLVRVRHVRAVVVRVDHTVAVGIAGGIKGLTGVAITVIVDVSLRGVEVCGAVVTDASNPVSIAVLLVRVKVAGAVVRLVRQPVIVEVSRRVAQRVAVERDVGVGRIRRRDLRPIWKLVRAGVRVLVRIWVDNIGDHVVVDVTVDICVGTNGVAKVLQNVRGGVPLRRCVVTAPQQ